MPLLHVHIDVHIGIRAQHTPALIPLDRSELGQHLHILVHAIDGAPDTPGQCSHSRGALLQQGRDERPAALGQSADEGTRVLEHTQATLGHPHATRAAPARQR